MARVEGQKVTFVVLSDAWQRFFRVFSPNCLADVLVLGEQVVDNAKSRLHISVNDVWNGREKNFL